MRRAVTENLRPHEISSLYDGKKRRSGMPKLSPRPAAVLALILITCRGSSPLRPPRRNGRSGAAPTGTTSPRSRGCSRSGRRAGPPLAWKATGLGGGLSSLAIAGGRIFTLGDRQGSQQVVAMNLADGKIVWTAKVGPVWEDEYGGPRGTPTVDGDRVYALGTEGDLVCLEAATGKEVWRKNLARDFGGRVMSMLEVGRVAAGRRRPADRDAGRRERDPGRPRQEDRQGDLARRGADPRRQGEGRRRLLVRGRSPTAAASSSTSSSPAAAWSRCAPRTASSSGATTRSPTTWRTSRRRSSRATTSSPRPATRRAARCSS